MPTVVRYAGHPDGYIDFDLPNEVITCQETIDDLSAQQLYDACLDVEDHPKSIGFLGIVIGEGKNEFTKSPLTVQLLRNWKLDKEGVGKLTVSGGTVVSETKGEDIFADNRDINFSNILAQFGVLIGSGETNTIGYTHPIDWESVSAQIITPVFIGSLCNPDTLLAQFDNRPMQASMGDSFLHAEFDSEPMKASLCPCH